MRRRNWKTCQPASLRQATEWCMEHAREKRNLSPERIAERMGLASHWVLYKWASEGRLPALQIPNFEHVCGINLVSRWLAATGGKLLIEIPTGRGTSTADMQQLQQVLHEATGALLAFYAGKQDANDTLAAIQGGLEGLAWHRGNVQQHERPQLDFGDSGDDH